MAVAEWVAEWAAGSRCKPLPPVEPAASTSTSVSSLEAPEFSWSHRLFCGVWGIDGMEGWKDRRSSV